MHTFPPPVLHVAQSYELSHGARVAAMMEMAGMPLLRWQKDMLNDWSAVDNAGKFIHRRCGASIPRQAGKSSDAIAWVTYLAAGLGMSVLYTAHNYSTTCEMLRRFRKIFGKKANDPNAEFPKFNRLVKHCENKTAQEAIFLKNGGRIHFSTRTKSASLGYSFDVIVYDEAQELTVEQMQAIAPTSSSGEAHNAQQIFIGTPHRPGSFGDMFAPMRSEAHGAPGDDLCWWEWGVPEIGDVTDESRWAEVNPSIEEGVADVEAIRLNCRMFVNKGEDGILAFAQEFLGYWLPDNMSEPPEISSDEWGALAVGEPPTEGRLAFGIKFALDGSTVAIAACRQRPDGLPHVEVARYRSMSEGVTWVADFCEARVDTACGFVVDGGGNGRDLCDELRSRRMPRNAVVAPGAADVAASCAGLLSAVREGRLTHFGQPALDWCVTHVKKRKIGRTGYGYEGIDGTDPSMVEAVALALWGVRAIKRDPNRRALVR